MTETSVEAVARVENSSERWSDLWRQEGDSSWRQAALAEVYSRIDELVPSTGSVIDVGGGVGILAERLAASTSRSVAVWDHSNFAVDAVRSKGMHAEIVDLEQVIPTIPLNNTVVATETIEHLSDRARLLLLASVANSKARLLVSVPNDRLGPDEEPQHTVKFTPISFLRLLRQFFPDARVEVLGPYLLGVCGYPRPYTLSMTLPVRDEAEDLAITLASFRGVADEIVVGIDSRTSDNTREIAEKYADTVFTLEDPCGPPGEEQPESGVHFAWVRNQCIDRCTGDWIFMTEGHERLHRGVDVLLNLHSLVEPGVRVCYVLRQLGDQQWGFPWLFKRAPDIRFSRPVHNTLDFPDGTYVVKIPQIVTLHERSDEKSRARFEQRRTQNRKSLMDDWVTRRNANSLYYLAAEWRNFDERRSREFFETLLQTSHNGPQRYQARLQLAADYAQDGDLKKCREILHGATADDWSRADHWIWLGDLAFEEKQFDQAYRFYSYASTVIGQIPFTLWWIERSYYSYLPAQRLAMVCCELERLDEALQWARRVVSLLPDDAPPEMRSECEDNITRLEEAINEGH